jgi:hypothetical protein
MSRLLKVSDEVYEALWILKRYPSTSFNDIIKGLVDQVCPGEFFDTDDIDRQLFREKIGLEDYTERELRLKRDRLRKEENKK